MPKLKLYSDLAEIYDQLYLNIFDYKEDAEFVDSILKKYQIKAFLELGCGSGHLANLLVKKGYKIMGVDLHEEMLQIARNRLPEVEFIQQDIRSLKLNRKFDAIIAIGRMFTYMTTNQDVEDSIRSIASCLKPNGIFLFDNFSAVHFVKNFQENMEIIHEAEIGKRKIKRISKNTWNLQNGVTFNWHAKYYIEEKGKTREIEDHSVLRAFCPGEIETVMFDLDRAVLSYQDVKVLK